MPCPKKKGHNPKKHRKHTPIESEAQRGFFGAELARRRAGETPRAPGITEKELVSHLKEVKGKKLPKRVKKSGKASSVGRHYRSG